MLLTWLPLTGKGGENVQSESAMRAAEATTGERLFAVDGGIVYGASALSVDGIVYSDADKGKCIMDYYPADGAAPHPAVIIVHGGAWLYGNSKTPGEVYPADFLVPAGYAVFSIDYRLGPKYTMLDMIEDIHRAVRFVRYNARQWGVDPEHIALLGGSAGGHLVSMAALLADREPKSDSTNMIDRTSEEVQAVIALYAPFDLRPLVRRPWHSGIASASDWHAMLRCWTEHGDTFDDAVMEASPISHIKADAPPFLLIHGTRDEAVDYEQAVRFHAMMLAAGVSCRLIPIAGGLHVTVGWHRLPNVPDWERMLVEWLNGKFHHDGPIGEGIRARVTRKSNSLQGN